MLIDESGVDNLARKSHCISTTQGNHFSVNKTIIIGRAKIVQRTIIGNIIIAVKNNDLALKRAALKKEADTAQADADAAYAIQQQEQQKTINIKTVEAEI